MSNHHGLLLRVQKYGSSSKEVIALGFFGLGGVVLEFGIQFIKCDHSMFYKCAVPSILSLI